MITPDASASIPELRSGRAYMWILIGGGALFAIAAIVVGIVVMRQDIDPGAAACDRLVDLPAQDPARWDRFATALPNPAEHRVFNPITRSRARITATDVDGRCRQSMAAFRDAM